MYEMVIEVVINIFIEKDLRNEVNILILTITIRLIRMNLKRWKMCKKSTIKVGIYCCGYEKKDFFWMKKYSFNYICIYELVVDNTSQL